MNIKTRLLIPCFTALILLSATLKAQEEKTDLAHAKMEAAFEIISNAYVDKLDANKIVEDGIKGIIKQLDPHSRYISAEKVNEENQKLASDFEGIGIQFNILDDTIMVISPIAGGPSEKLGIIAGDKIIFIEDENVAGNGIDNEGVRDRLLGKKGTLVKVRIHRRGIKKLLDFTITRDKIPLYSVDAAYMVDDKTGYIKINRFASGTVQEFREAIAQLKPQGLENLVLDLTGNGGGYLYAAFELADEFLSTNKMIVYTEGAASPKRELNASPRGEFEKGKLVVLIDEGSASASEIVTGAIQDWDRGLVIGRRSFGKGLVQKPFELPDGSELRLTIARYFTPTGRSIQKPYENGRESYYEETYNRFYQGELMGNDDKEFPDSLKYYTPNKRIVYGGGGIMPDIFVPLDTSQNSNYLTEIARNGILNQFALNYVDKHREDLLKSYDDNKQFKANFKSESVMKEFLKYAAGQGVDENEKDLVTSGNLIKTQLKALIGRNLWDFGTYYFIFNDSRKDFNKAIEMINNEDAFRQMRVDAN